MQPTIGEKYRLKRDTPWHKIGNISKIRHDDDGFGYWMDFDDGNAEAFPSDTFFDWFEPVENKPKDCIICCKTFTEGITIERHENGFAHPCCVYLKECKEKDGGKETSFCSSAFAKEMKECWLDSHTSSDSDLVERTRKKERERCLKKVEDVRKANWTSVTRPWNDALDAAQKAIKEK